MPTLVLLLASCGGGKSYTVEVQNLSAKRFDSVHVFVNTGTNEEPTVKCATLLSGETAPPFAVGEIFGGRNHAQTRATAIFYAADTVIKSNMPQTAQRVPKGITRLPLIAAYRYSGRLGTKAGATFLIENLK